jgi:hypothetical protein
MNSFRTISWSHRNILKIIKHSRTSGISFKTSPVDIFKINLDMLNENLSSLSDMVNIPCTIVFLYLALYFAVNYKLIL